VSAVTFDRVASAYDTFMGRWTRVFMPSLLREAGVAPGQRVLDLATGTAASALVLAETLGPRGSVVGADISWPMLQAARAKVEGRPIRLVAADGQALACRAEVFDRVVCQLGLMFFPDPVAGVREARRVLRPGGRFAALVWSAPERVPWFWLLGRELVQYFPERRDDLFIGSRLADAGRLKRILVEAGLRDVRIVIDTRDMEFRSFEEYWSHVESGAIRIGQMLNELSPDTAEAIRTRVHAAMTAFAVGDRLVIPTEAVVADGWK
jgi:ubiquinone/menaquinone biosynthesis C-methylase UbiE